MTKTSLRSRLFLQEMKMNMKRMGPAAFVRGSGHPRSFKASSPAVLGGLLLGATVGLSACGGSPSQSVDIRIEGLRAEGLVISLTPQADEVQIPASGTAHTFSGLAPSQPYNITVRKHPLNQLCQVANGNGTSQAPPSPDVAILCHRTLLNDTGSELADDGAAGRDAVSSALTKTGSGDKAFDFSRLCVKDAQGQVEVCKSPKTAADVGPALGGWVCTLDNVTGLVWRVADPDGTGALCGIPADQWFIPTAREFTGVLDYGRLNPAVSQGYLPQLGTDKYVLTLSDAAVYYLTSEDGLVSEGVQGDEFSTVHVAKSKNPVASFVQTSVEDRLFVDQELELMWQMPAAPSAFTFTAAQSSATALRTGGHSDWRLPNYKELVALFDADPTCASEVCGVLKAYLAAGSLGFWSSTVYAGDGTLPVNNRARLTLQPSDGGFETQFLASNFEARAIFVRNLTGTEVPP